MSLQDKVRRWLGIPNPVDAVKWQTSVTVAIQKLRGNQMTTQDELTQLTDKVTAFATAFAAFVQSATTTKQNDENRIADLTTKYNAALAADALDASQIAALQAQNQQLVAAGGVNDTTVAAQLQTASDALDSLKTQLDQATVTFAPAVSTDPTSVPTNTDSGDTTQSSDSATTSDVPPSSGATDGTDPSSVGVSQSSVAGNIEDVHV